MSADDMRGRWFRLAYRSPKADRVRQVVGTLRQAMVPIILEEEDREGVVHVLPDDTSLRVGSLWSVFVPEDSFREVRRTLRKLPIPITTDRAGKGTRRSDERQGAEVALWLVVLLTSLLALTVCVLIWRGAIVVTWEEAVNGLIGVGLVVIVIGLPIYAACHDARRWLRSRHRRFVFEMPGHRSD